MSAPHVLSDREALEQFKEKHPELASVHKIASFKEEEFVQQYSSAFSGGVKQARRVHKEAVSIHQKTALIWANIKDIASPFLNRTLFNNIPNSFLEHQQSIPGYDKLFQNLDYIESDPCRSIFGPAAYFVDLMRFVEENITDKNSFPQVPVGEGIPDELKLDRRRRDLFNLKLDCNNTSDLIAFIDLVNEVLETIVTDSNYPEADSVVEAADFPLNLPYNIPLEEIRSYLKQLKLNLAEIYQAFETTPATKATAIARESLALSPKEFERMRSEIITPAALSEYYGLDINLSGDQGLENVTVFLAQTGLTRQELNELIYQDLDRNEVNAGLSRLFFINCVNDGLGYLTIEQGKPVAHSFHQVPEERLVNLSPAKLDRIYRFLKLARKLEWSFADLDWALRSLQKPYESEKVLHFDGVNDYVEVRDVNHLNSNSLTIEAWVNPSHHRRNPILGKGREHDHKIDFQVWTDKDGKLAFFNDQVTETNYPRSLKALPEGVFSHIAVAIASTEIKFFINGKLDNTVVLSQPISTTGTNLNIGRNLNDTCFAGSIKDVRIWSGVRSEDAIASSRYQRLTGLETGLLSYWPLIEDLSNQLVDLSSNQKHGVMGGTEFVTQPKWLQRDLILDPLPERLLQTAYHFNGVDQYLAARNVTGLDTNQLTLEAWITLEKASENIIISKGDEGSQQPQFLFSVNAQGNLSFSSTSLAQSPYLSQSSIAPQQRTHVCVTVSETAIRFYINGKLDQEYPLSNSISLKPQGNDLILGRNFKGNYFNGLMQEVRLWNRSLTQGQIQQGMHRTIPSRSLGLVGYWSLNQIEANQAMDHSFNRNHLELGGIAADYMPDRVQVGPLLPQTPIATTGTVLELDGANDLIRIHHPQNIGLGNYERITLELWFKPTDLNLHRDRQQVIVTQGDAEAGLNAYLYHGRLHVITWCADYEQTQIQETVYISERIQASKWYHLAITNDETQAPDTVEFRAYLDGAVLPFDSSTHIDPTLSPHQMGYQLSPVGDICLGGIGVKTFPRFKGEFVDAVNLTHYSFAGQLTDFRLWNRVKTDVEINRERFAAPTLPDSALLAYLPIDEGEGTTLRDRTGNMQTTVQAPNTEFVGTAQDAGLVNIHSHYNAAGVMKWSNYAYTGRIFVDSLNGAEEIGVTFFNRHPEKIDQYYRLQLQENRFELTANPQGIQKITPENGEIAIPLTQAKSWYRFLIEAENNSTQQRTDIRVKVWLDGTPEPQNFQLKAFDNSDIRIQSGTVGIWALSEGVSPRFDDLRVLPLGINVPELTDYLLLENFETYHANQDPSGWIDTGDRRNPEGSIVLFKPLPLDNRSVLGTDSELENIHAHFAPSGADVLSWKNYEATGRMRMTDASSGIGVTFLSRYPEQLDQYYSLRRDANRGTFHLVAHPHGVQPIRSLLTDRDGTDTGITPKPDTWYRFRIKVEDNENEQRTLIRAKVWQDGTPEPTEFQIQAFDSSSIRIKSGTVGLWASGKGAKYFDQLTVPQEVLLSENFDSNGVNQDPTDWKDTKHGNSHEEANFFKTAQINHVSTPGNIAFGTVSPLTDIHSHYKKTEALRWSNYTYTGRMYLRQDSGGGLGVTFLSRYPDPTVTEPNHDRYYSLIRFEGGEPNFYLSAHRGNGITLNSNSTSVIQGSRKSGIKPILDTWYRFKIEVEDTGSRTLIRAKIWKDGTNEPGDFQIEAFDETSDRLTAGTIGFWGGFGGEKFFDDLHVQRQQFLTSHFVAAHWQQSARNQFEISESLFKTVEVENAPLWLTIYTYPTLLRPLNDNALQFDGKREYLTSVAQSGTGQGKALHPYTIEAWINPSINQQNPVMSWKEHPSDKDATWFGVSEQGIPILVYLNNGAFEIVPGMTALLPGTFNHIALILDSNVATFYVNGQKAGEQNLSRAIALDPTTLEVGRDQGSRYFGGQIRDLRLWQTAQTVDHFALGIRYQQPQPEASDLVAYWSFAETDGAIAQDSTRHAVHLRLGGLENARKPILKPGVQPNQGFWRSERQVLQFQQEGDRILLEDVTTPVIRQRRTIEIWFRVAEKDIASRKQVIYHEGDGQRGLVLYIHDGSLYFGGYNVPVDESNWQGTWLHTDRITSGRWHHAALVLDGRAELRHESFQAFLDGKAVDTGVGSQLWQHRDRLTLGGVVGSIRFHDGQLQDGTAHFLAGQILELRIWNTSRTVSELARDRDQELIGNERHLALWWQFDGLTTNNLQIDDRANHGHIAQVKDASQLQRLATNSGYTLPVIELGETTLKELATIRQLQEQLNQPIERLIALWFNLRYFGQEDGQTLFDLVFNPKGMVIEPWHYHQSNKIRWDFTGQEDQSRDREIRSRLMGALQVSSEDLDLLVQRLSGSETTIALDSAYLTRLYRLSQIAKVLRLTVRSCLRLMDLMGLAEINSLEEFVKVSDRSTWSKRTGFDPDELDFLANDVLSSRMILPYTEASIRDLADQLTRQSKDFLVKDTVFVTDEVNQVQAIELVEFLQNKGLIDHVGAVTTQYTRDAITLEDLAVVLNWKVRFGEYFSALSAKGIVSNRGVVLNADADLTTVFSDAITRSSAAELLEQQKVSQAKIQSSVNETLIRLRNEHINAILASLSELLHAEPELMQVVIDHFAATVTPAVFIGWMLDIFNAPETHPIPANVTDYLYKLTKILYLVSQLQFTPTETAALLDKPEAFNVQNVLRPDIVDLDHLFTFAELKAAFGDGDGKLVSLLMLPIQAREDVVQSIAAIAGWEKRQLETLMDYLYQGLPANRIELLHRLQQGFSIAETMAVEIDFPIQLAHTNDLTLNFYRQQSSALLKVLRARYDDEQWERVYKPLRAPLAEQKRDAMLSIAMRRLGQNYQGRKDADILSEYLLLDVQTGSEVLTSRIVQATAALQLYVQRCLMNLEKGVNPASIPSDQWEWMKNYRVWEANRKVFLYPENYIEPELRDTKTPLFEELEQELMQSDINQSSVEQTFTNYLNKLAELAELKVVGAYLHRDESKSATAEADETLYLVGRTTTNPRIYYYRKLVNKTQWLPWKKIDLSLNADYVAPVLAFNRLFLFWVEFTNTTKKGTKEGDPDRTVYLPVIYYSYHDFNNAWVPPQKYAEVKQELEADQIQQPEHQRVYALSTWFTPPTDDRSLAAEHRERILVLYGDPNEVTALRNTRDREPFTLQFLDQMVTNWANARISYDIDLSLPFRGRVDLDTRNTLNNQGVLRRLLDTFPDPVLQASFRAIEPQLLQELRAKFSPLGITLQNDVAISQKGHDRWLLINGNEQLLVKVEDNHLSVYTYGNPFLHLTRTTRSNIHEFRLASDPTLNLSLSTEELRLDFSRVLDARNSSEAATSQTAFEGKRNRINVEFSTSHQLLKHLSLETSLMDVTNQAGWYILNTGEEQFLLRPIDFQKLNTDSERLTFPHKNSPGYQTIFTFTSPPALAAQEPPPRFSFERLNTSAIHELSLTLFREGLDGLLSLRSQQSPERNFGSYSYEDGRIIPPQRAPGSTTDTIDFTGAYGMYYREIFFHIPFLIANQLNANQNFADAQRWYHYIFNPTSQEPHHGSSPNSDRYWQYLPFRNLTLETLTQILNNQAALAEYKQDPFDPHAIAQLRINAYQKAIVMKYIDNLLDWGDLLFTQSTRESINEAVLLYVLAYNLLGQRPEARANRKFEEIGDYQAIHQSFTEVPDFLTDFTLNGNTNSNGNSNGSIALPQNGSILTTFSVVENAEFVGFWDRVEDRLFKIRRSLNIEGIYRQLDLFQPPLDVRAIVAAVAGGGRDLSSILSDLDTPVPHYRFSYMLEKAKDMTSNVIELGAALFEAIQGRDAERLEALQNTHERVILDMTTSLKRNAINEIKETISNLNVTQQKLENRKNYFEELTHGIGLASLTSEERDELILMGAAQTSRAAAVTATAVAAISSAAPDAITGTIVGAGGGAVTLATAGGSNLTKAATATAAGFEIAADILSTAGDMTGKIGEYKQRLKERRLELRTIKFDLEELSHQLAIANINLQTAEHELRIHERTIQHQQEIADFHRRKFSNQELYNWMITRLSGLYFQTYKLAYATAKAAERAMQYEFATDDRFISFGHWDSLKRGLLAGESLMLELNRMDKYATDNDSRYLEIEKTISLKHTFLEAFETLKKEGTCTFQLSEMLFNDAYPGHYFRVIRGLALSVKGVPVDQSLNATLIQLGNKTLIEPDIGAVRYLMGVEGATLPPTQALRVNWRANQQIAVSKPSEDYGMFGNFDLNFRFDDRYFPFEGTGAVSSWELEMPQAKDFNLNDPDVDIVIHLKYMAKGDRSSFKQQVEAEMRNLNQ